MSIIKNLIKLFVVMFVATLLLTSCDLLEKGGTIIVKIELTYDNLVIIVKVENVSNLLDNPNIKDAFQDLKDNKGTKIEKGSEKPFSYDEDGTYVVTALTPGFCTIPVTLIGGVTLTVSLETKEEASQE
jgi:hypothetical protein